MSKSKPEALLGLSMNDARLILLANYIAGDPKVDYEKLAQIGGYKSGSSAGVMYRNAKRKLSEYDPGNAGTTSTPDATPANTPKKTPNKRKSVPNTPKGGNDGDNDGVDVEEPSPSKQKRQRNNSVKQETTVKKSSDDLFVPAVKMEDELFPGVKTELDDESSIPVHG